MRRAGRYFVILVSVLVWTGCASENAAEATSTAAGTSATPATSGTTSAAVPTSGAASGGALSSSAMGGSANAGATTSSAAGAAAMASGGALGIEDPVAMKDAAAEPPGSTGPFKVLVFSATVGFRHDSIGVGISTIMELGQEHDFSVEASEDPTIFNDAALADYEAVVFLQSNGLALAAEERAAFERYIQGGGGFVGVHCASCTDNEWPWYQDLLGARFVGHPEIQRATIKIEGHDHASTKDLPDEWERDEELYNFEANPRGTVTVLATLDESSYSGGTMGADHPISWYHEFEGGRSWYTGLGHLIEGYGEAEFRSHLLGGIEYAAGRAP